MPKLTIDIDIPEMSPEEIREAVINAAVEDILGKGFPRDEHDEGDRSESRNWFLKHLRQEVQDRVSKIAGDIVEAETRSMIQEVLTKPFQQYNFYGERKGNPTSLRDLIYKEGIERLGVVVDPDTGRADGYTTRPRIPYVNFLVRKEVDEVFKSELHREVTKAAAEVKAGLVGKVSAAITDTVAALLGLPKR